MKDVLARRGAILCKPWVARNRNLFTKADFVINMRNRTIECPAGEIEHFQPGAVVEFDPDRPNPVTPLRDLWQTGYVITDFDSAGVTLEIPAQGSTRA